MDEITLKLNSPITDEQWDAITDVDFEHTNEISFHTKHGKIVKFVKASAQPERLTDDDFETIRIHLNAYKEKLCNQQRWKEAEEYQRIIDRFMAFASAQPERTCEYWDNESKFCALCRPSAQPEIRCKDCRHYEWTSNRVPEEQTWYCYKWNAETGKDDYCSYAERKA